MNNIISSAANWNFLQEPLWRWVVFLIAISFLMGVWAMILGYMKAA